MDMLGVLAEAFIVTMIIGVVAIGLLVLGVWLFS